MVGCIICMDTNITISQDHKVRFSQANKDIEIQCGITLVATPQENNKVSNPLSCAIQCKIIWLYRAYQ